MGLDGSLLLELPRIICIKLYWQVFVHPKRRWYIHHNIRICRCTDHGAPCALHQGMTYAQERISITHIEMIFT